MEKLKQQNGYGSTYVVIEVTGAEPSGVSFTQHWFWGSPFIEWACVVCDYSCGGSPARELDKSSDEMHIEELNSVNDSRAANEEDSS